MNPNRDPPRHLLSHAPGGSEPGGQPGMLIVETIAKIRRLFRTEHRSIREISRELRLSRKVVRKALRSDRTAFAYKRQRQPRRRAPPRPPPQAVRRALRPDATPLA